jgi:hypothetical protein
MEQAVSGNRESGRKWLTAVRAFCYHVIKSDVIGGNHGTDADTTD